MKVDARVMCADPSIAAAGSACCRPMDRGNQQGDSGGPGLGVCEYAHEQMKFATAQRRCQSTPSPRPIDGPWVWESWDTTPVDHFIAAVPDGSGPSQCLPKTDQNVRVRCCSDTPIDKMPGDISVQTYRQQTSGTDSDRYDDCIAAFPSMPYMASRIPNFSERQCDDAYPEGERGCGPYGDNIGDGGGHTTTGCLNKRTQDYAADACAMDGARLAASLRLRLAVRLTPGAVTTLT